MRSEYRADLHIHTLLSPCGEVEMVPSLIVEAARTAGLDIIGIADHNSCDNAGAVMEAAEGTGVRVLPGLEVQSVEGIHLLCLFDTLETARALRNVVYERLMFVPGAMKFYNEQMMVDSTDEFVGYCERPISLPTSMEIEEVHGRVVELGGVIIPTHIDRRGTGLCDVLGMLPEEPDFEAVEISRNITADEARLKYPSIGGRAVVLSSDAHWLSAIGKRRTVFHLEHRNIAEIGKALRGEDGRRLAYA